MIRIPIYKQYVFAKLKADKTIKYFTPTEAQMNYAGWYRLVNVFEDGEDYVLDNILYHYVGTPANDEEEEGGEL